MRSEEGCVGPSGEGDAEGAECECATGGGAVAPRFEVGRKREAVERVKGGENAKDEVGDGGADEVEATFVLAAAVGRPVGTVRGVGEAARVAPSERVPNGMLGRKFVGTAGAAEAARRGGTAVEPEPGPETSSSS